MNKKSIIIVIISCIMVFILPVVFMVSCWSTRLDGCAYFSTVDEMIDYFKPTDTAVYEAIRKPDDERFVECGYLSYNINNPNGYKVKVKNDYVLAFYRVDINGESVYVVFFSYLMFPETFLIADNGKQYAESVRVYDEPQKINAPESFRTSYVFKATDSGVVYDNENHPIQGFVKQINEGEIFSDSEFINQSNWFGFRDKHLAHLMEVWAIYDTRDVPQAEKDALALELMEVLYNNYKLAGQKAE